MDRRQLKTRKAILGAFRGLLAKKRYDHITVQEIIDTADVGRSTFYAHFETKDLLLDALCQELFCHMIEQDTCHWVGTDDSLQSKLSHTLWHIRESKEDLAGIFLSDSGELFLRYLKNHLKDMFAAHSSAFKTPVPREFMLNHLAGSFCEAIFWWIREGMVTEPETVAQYFMYMTEIHER